MGSDSGIAGIVAEAAVGKSAARDEEEAADGESTNDRRQGSIYP